MKCQGRFCNSAITHRVRASDFPDEFYEYRCVLHAAHLMCDPLWDVLELSKTSPIITRPDAFDGLSNRNRTGVSPGRYVLIRCETIRERFRKNQITWNEARESLYATLAAIGSIGIDQMEPGAWLLKGIKDGRP